MARGGMGRSEHRLTLADRLELTRRQQTTAPTTTASTRPGQPRHVWVVEPPSMPGKHPGLLIEWRQGRDGWHGLTVYVVDSPTGRATVQEWLASAYLEPAD